MQKSLRKNTGFYLAEINTSLNSLNLMPYAFRVIAVAVVLA